MPDTLDSISANNMLKDKFGLVSQEMVLVDKNMKTSIDGIYACGDCTGGLLQISKSVHQGTIAGLEAIKYLRR